nr:hypothetical protein [Amycolatopsis pithecellobii]
MPRVEDSGGGVGRDVGVQPGRVQPGAELFHPPEIRTHAVQNGLTGERDQRLDPAGTGIADRSRREVGGVDAEDVQDFRDRRRVHFLHHTRGLGDLDEPVGDPGTHRAAERVHGELVRCDIS